MKALEALGRQDPVEIAYGRYLTLREKQALEKAMPTEVYNPNRADLQNLFEMLNKAKNPSFPETSFSASIQKMRSPKKHA